MTTIAQLDVHILLCMIIIHIEALIIVYDIAKKYMTLIAIMNTVWL